MADKKTPTPNKTFAAQEQRYNLTIAEAKKLIERLKGIAIPIEAAWTIPITDFSSAGNIDLESAVTDYGVDPDNDLIAVYVRARGATTGGSSGNSLGMLRQSISAMERDGVMGYIRLYQDFYPGADAVSQLLNVPEVIAAIRKVLAGK